MCSCRTRHARDPGRAAAVTTPTQEHEAEARARLGVFGILPGTAGVASLAQALAAAERRGMERAAGIAEHGTATLTHASDCALHNAPAYPAQPCDCGVFDTAMAIAQAIRSTP